MQKRDKHRRAYMSGLSGGYPDRSVGWRARPSHGIPGRQWYSVCATPPGRRRPTMSYYYFSHTRHECLSIVEIDCALPGCQPGCEYSGMACHECQVQCRVCGNPQTWRETVPTCSRASEYDEWRAAVFARAQAVCDGLMATHWRKAHREWLRISAEYREGICPFWSSGKQAAQQEPAVNLPA